MFPRRAPLDEIPVRAAITGGVARADPFNAVKEAVPPSGDNRERLSSSDDLWGALWATEVELDGADVLGAHFATRRPGTFFAISGRHALTAEHVLQRRSSRVVVRHRRVRMSRFDDADMQTLPNVSDATSLQVEFSSDFSDLALLRFSTPEVFSETLELGATIGNGRDLKGEAVLVAGYPFENGGEDYICRAAAGEIVGVKNGQIYYRDLATTPGQSGSPVVLVRTGKVIGVHVRGDVSAFGETHLNEGTALTQARKREIDRWLKE